MTEEGKKGEGRSVKERNKDVRTLRGARIFMRTPLAAMLAILVPWDTLGMCFTLKFRPGYVSSETSRMCCVGVGCAVRAGPDRSARELPEEIRMLRYHCPCQSRHVES